MGDATVCRECGSDLSPDALECPGCHRLTHGERLGALAASAERRERDGNPGAALAAWREALWLLPPGSLQYEQVAARIEGLEKLGVEAAAESPAAPRAPFAREDPEDAHAGWGRTGLAGAGAVGLFLLKFKVAAFFLLAKAKFLLLGLTKAKTFLSMLVYFGVYWQRFGWRFGLGLVLSIYVHEMGHVYVLNRYGVRTGAPLFIPMFGAAVWHDRVEDRGQNARVALAGPAWGMGAALGCFIASLLVRSPFLAAVAQYGAFINLLNLIPVWILDGGQAFGVLNRSQRWLAAAAVAGVWAVTNREVVILLVLGAAFRAVTGGRDVAPDRGVLVQYLGLVAGLTSLLLIRVGP